MDARRERARQLRAVSIVIRLRRILHLLIAVALGAIVIGCSPDRALDFGPVGEISSPPADQLSRDVLREFAGRDFILGNNDREAHVRLAEWSPGRGIILPFWLGVNPLYPGFLRPYVGHIYVISQSVLVRPVGNNEYLIRTGSKLFKSDTLFEAVAIRYADTGGMLPTIVRFVGTRIITVPRDPPATGTITEKVPVLREVSLPMRTKPTDDLAGYAKFEVIKPDAAAAPAGTAQSSASSASSSEAAGSNSAGTSSKNRDGRPITYPKLRSNM
jgi:hypothetical protein